MPVGAVEVQSIFAPSDTHHFPFDSVPIFPDTETTRESKSMTPSMIRFHEAAERPDPVDTLSAAESHPERAYPAEKVAANMKNVTAE